MTATHCANPHCRSGGDPEPVYGLEVICPYCTRRLESRLLDLGHVHDELETVLAAGSASSARFDKVAGSRTPPVPVRLEVTDHRDTIRHLLVSWTRLVIEERGLTRWPDDRPRAMAGYLASHLDWLAQHPAAGDLCDEVGTTLGRARRLLQPPEARLWVPCPGLDGHGCDGRIPVTVDATLVWCADCGFRTDDLRLLGRLLRQNDTPLITAIDACHRLRTEGIDLKPATIRSWVARHKVTARDRDPAGRLLYDIEELRRVARDSPARKLLTT